MKDGCGINSSFMVSSLLFHSLVYKTHTYIHTHVHTGTGRKIAVYLRLLSSNGWSWEGNRKFKGWLIDDDN